MQFNFICLKIARANGNHEIERAPNRGYHQCERIASMLLMATANEKKICKMITTSDEI